MIHAELCGAPYSPAGWCRQTGSMASRPPGSVLLAGITLLLVCAQDCLLVAVSTSRHRTSLLSTWTIIQRVIRSAECAPKTKHQNGLLQGYFEISPSSQKRWVQVNSHSVFGPVIGLCNFRVHDTDAV